MRVWTYGEGLAKIKGELDLTNETFLTPDEYVGLWNDAIQIASAEISKLGVEDEYFTKAATIALVNGQSRYSLPADIYPHKIRQIVYARGVEIYPVLRLRRRHKFLNATFINQQQLDACYQYYIENADVATGYKMVLVPASRETDPGGSPSININYIRETLYIPLVSAGSQAATDATKIDIPEFMIYIFSDVKAAIAAKIPHPNLQKFEETRDKNLVRMIATLTEQVVDDATEVEPDTTHYEESN